MKDFEQTQEDEGIESLAEDPWQGQNWWKHEHWFTEEVWDKDYFWGCKELFPKVLKLPLLQNWGTENSYGGFLPRPKVVSGSSIHGEYTVNDVCDILARREPKFRHRTMGGTDGHRR